MAEESAKLRIPYIAASQAQKHVTHNEALTLLDTLVQLSVLDKDLTGPPAEPDEGDCYIVAAEATGAWLGWATRVVRFIDGEWRSYLPGAGWLAWVLDEDAMYRFDGEDWTLAGIEGPQGDQGDQGDPWDQWEGAWQTATPYALNDAVENDGSSYLCIQAHTSGSDDDEPGVGANTGTYWDLLAAKGADGAGAVSSVNGQTGAVVLPLREVLTANRTYYVRQDGDNGNDGLADNAGGAFLTIAKAMEVLGTIDANGKTVTVQVGAGTWNVGIGLVNVVGIASAGKLIIVGDETTPSNVTINSSGFAAFFASGLYTPWDIRGFKIVATSNGLATSQGSVLGFQNIDFGAAGGAHVASLNGYILATGDYTISGDAAIHWSTARLGVIEVFNRTVTLTDTPAFSSAFANAADISYMIVASNTFSGSATGKRYSSTDNSKIASFGATLPGDVAGTMGTGGLYN